jgi:hypothetical protein
MGQRLILIILKPRTSDRSDGFGRQGPNENAPFGNNSYGTYMTYKIVTDQMNEIQEKIENPQKGRKQEESRGR